MDIDVGPSAETPTNEKRGKFEEAEVVNVGFLPF